VFGLSDAGAGTKLQRLCGAVVRSIKEECLDRLLVLGERHLRRASGEFVAHCHGERNHHGLGNELIQPVGLSATSDPVRAGNEWVAC
jgi:hypothetical protein